MKNEIIPSVRLEVVSVHKLLALKCMRFYYWTFIRNLESKNLSIPLWWGSVHGEGWESALMGKDWRKAMKREDKKHCKGKRISTDVAEDMDVIRSIIEIQIECGLQQPIVKDFKITETQSKFAVPLKCGVTFCGTKDAVGTDQGVPTLFENKTASQVTPAYLESLRYGKQVNGYAWSEIKERRENRVTQCRCCVFRKPALRVKKDQSIEEFKDEIRCDIMGGTDYRGKKRAARPDHYYRWLKFTFGKKTVMDVGRDIEQETFDLLRKYEGASEKQILDPYYWPRRENKCSEYAGCQFQALCKDVSRWEMYLGGFKQREMLYKQEEEELK